MSNETLLKQNFREKDIQRIRNLMSGKYGNKTTTQIGYTKEITEYKEGDVWEESNKMWTIKDGIKQTYTKLDDIKHIYRIPMICPKCHNKMGSSLDKKMWPIHNMCHNCVIEYESSLKRDGKYEEYSKRMMKANAGTFIDEAKDFIIDYADQLDQSFITEEGDKETWEGSGKKHTVQKMIKELDELKEQISDI